MKSLLNKVNPLQKSAISGEENKKGSQNKLGGLA